MSTLAIEIAQPQACHVFISEDTLTVELTDARSISVPLTWYPRLLYASQREQQNWRLIGNGHGIHWEEIDEDISVIGLLAGKPSQESQKSLKKWLEKRTSLQI